MKQAIDDLKNGMTELQKEDKRLTAALVNQEGEVCKYKRQLEKIRNQIRDYKTALAVLRVAEGHGTVLLDEEDIK